MLPGIRAPRAAERARGDGVVRGGGAQVPGSRGAPGLRVEEAAAAAAAALPRKRGTLEGRAHPALPARATLLLGCVRGLAGRPMVALGGPHCRAGRAL